MTPLQQLREKTLTRLGEFRPGRFGVSAPLAWLTGWPTLGVLPLFALISRSRALAAWLSEMLADLVTLLRASGHDSADLWRIEKIAGRLAGQRGHGRMPMLMALVSIVLAVLFIPAAIALLAMARDQSLLWRIIVLAVVFGGSWVLLLYAAYTSVGNTLNTQQRLVADAVSHLSAISTAAGGQDVSVSDPPPTPPWVYLAILPYLPTIWGVVMIRQTQRWSEHVGTTVRGVAAQLAERFDQWVIQPGADATLVLPDEPAGDSRVCPDAQCGAANPREADFCKRCGRRLNEEAQ